VDSIDLGDGLVGLLSSLELDKAESAGVALLISGHLAGKDVPELGEGVVQGAGVNRLVQVLDEDVAGSGLAHRGVPVLPHDAAWPALDLSVVQGVESTLSVNNVVEVDVGIAQGATGHRITANTDGSNRSHDRESLEELRLSDIGVQVADIKGGRSQGRLGRSSSVVVVVVVVGGGGGGIGGGSGSRHCYKLVDGFFVFLCSVGWSTPSQGSVGFVFF